VTDYGPSTSGASSTSSASTTLPAGGTSPQAQTSNTGTSSQPQLSDATEGGGGIPGGAIGGIVGGIIGGFLILGIAGFLLYRRQAQRNQVVPPAAPYYREEHDEGYKQAEPKPFTTEETRPAIRYPDFDETADQGESGPVGGRLRYPE